MSYIRRWSLLVLLLAVSGSSHTTAVPSSAPRVAGALPPEVRLRKMHLVRPDLIPYPIAIEVYC